MGEQIDDHWIGRRVRALRLQRGWTVRGLAETAGLSATQLSRIESGARQASVGTLIELSRIFSITLSELVADLTPAAVHVTRVDDRVVHESASGDVAVLSGELPDLHSMHLTVGPHCSSPPADHDGEEWVYVLHGEVDLVVGGSDDDSITHALRPGDAAHFQGRSTHHLVNRTEEPCALLLVGSRDRTAAR
ncbi:hypothetical protein ASG12_12915 [Williamsia sp. Leaf354]|jgi:transcriptional regulator with XRE-family HTH domain|uniref:helix-turn-helix domain-containing protein n=1 Tax=Williamsia sp. Leaf354 TaxID=1736349 RepID=UPI000700F436|nr:XRE family transcriptional regulator [Williamsia sp. Leaf354]KQR97919.1 hypothetical protein ASG12_12915 [Williamsia sp. Leaf354]